MSNTATKTACTLSSFANLVWDNGRLDLVIIQHVRALKGTDELRAQHKLTYLAARIAKPNESRGDAEKRAAEIIAATSRDKLFQDILTAERAKWSYWISKAGLGTNAKATSKKGAKARATDKPESAPETKLVPQGDTAPVALDPVAHIRQQATSLMHFAKKNAKAEGIGPYAAAVETFARLIREADAAAK